MQNEQNVAPTPPLTEPAPNPDKYLVYPEDDGYDRPLNPYSQV
jgi:hypothetical protein